MLARLKFDISDLVNSILDQIPHDVIVNGTFLDPAIGGGQFVKEVEARKRAAGKTDEEIKKTVFGFEGNVLRMDYAKNKHNLNGSYIVGNFLKELVEMKFDVIVGNPPYQDAVGQNTIYPKFYAKSISLLKEDGYLAMITPPAIIPGLWGVKNPDGIKMPKPINIKHIVIGDSVKKYFPKVSSDFCYFILQNTTPNNLNVPVQTDIGIVHASGPIFPMVKIDDNLDIAQSILDKCFQFNRDYYKATSADHGRKAKADPYGSHLAVEAISTEGVLRTRNITWLKKHEHFGHPKVILPMYGKVAFIDYSHNLVSAAQEKVEGKTLTGHNISTVLTNSDAESESLVSVLESRIQVFFNRITKETRAPYVNFLKNFIGVPLNQKYNNDTLEDVLGLTEEEKKWLDDNF